MDERGGSSQNSGGSSKDSRVSLTLLPVSSSSGSSFESSSMSSLGLSNLRSISNWLGSNTGIDRCNGKLWVEGWGNKGLGVESGSNREVGVENRETGVSNSESSSVSNVLNLLKLTVGINIRVSSGDSSIGVSNLCLGRVKVRVTIVQVAKLILGLELAAGNIGS